MKSREVKITIKGSDDPDILKWANTLKYGVLPKLILEILRWYEKNGLLVRGGVNQPDILPPQIPLNQESLDLIQLNKILSIVLENNDLLKSGVEIRPTENLESESTSAVDIPVVQSNLQAEILQSNTDEHESTSQPLIANNPFVIYR